MTLKNIINEEIRNFVTEEEFFDPTLPDDIKRLSKKFVGKNVIWYGDPDQMIVIPAEDVHGMSGNIYDYEKLQFVVDLILESPELVEFECSYGIGSVVTLIDIREHQEAEVQDRFMIDQDGHDRPYSTGDNELDKYIGTEDMSDQEFVYMITSDPNILKFFDEHKYDLVNGKETEESLTQKFNELNPDEDDFTAFEEFLSLEVELAEAFRNQTGDIGVFKLQLRDGHHRVMGAIKAGEDYVCANLAKEQLGKFDKYIRKV